MKKKRVKLNIKVRRYIPTYLAVERDKLIYQYNKVEGLSYRQIGHIFRMTGERVHQIVKKEEKRLGLDK